METLQEALRAAEAAARTAQAAADAMRGERNAAHAAELEAKRAAEAAEAEAARLGGEAAKLRDGVRKEREDAAQGAAQLRALLECAPLPCARCCPLGRRLAAAVARWRCVLTWTGVQWAARPPRSTSELLARGQIHGWTESCFRLCTTCGACVQGEAQGVR